MSYRIRMLNDKWALSIISAVLGLITLSGMVAVPTAGAEALPDELRGFTISNSFMPLDAKPVGRIRALRGKLVVRHGRTFKAYYAKRGDRLYKNDILYTLKGARCRVRLVTADIITMAADTRISMDNVVDDRKKRKKNTRFSVLKGKAMFYVIRLFRYKTVSSEVKTPTAVCGVRGTKFGVKVAPLNKVAAQLQPLYLADASGTLPPGLLAQATGEPQTQTTVYGFDGQVAVTSTVDGTTQTVGAGQNVVMGTTGSGPVVVTPPSEASQFSSETEAAPDMGSNGEGDGDSGEAGETDSSGTSETGEDESSADGEEGEDQDTTTDTGTGDADAALAGAEASATDLTQVTTTIAIQTQQSGKVGYFSALLTRWDGSTAYTLADIYANKDPQYMQTGSVTVNSIVNSQGFLKANGTDTPEGDVYLEQIKSIPGDNTDTGSLGTSRRMDNSDTAGYPDPDDFGSNNYMSWGLWRMSNWVYNPTSGYYYAVVMQAYRLEGEITPTEVAAGIVGHYSGPAYGTYFETNNSLGTEMTGTFQCNVNVPANSITNFEIDVADVSNSKTAYISGGTGSFLPGSTSSFTITGGTWKLGPVGAEMDAHAARKAANGSLFGPSGEHIGGSWGMDSSGGGNNAAVGIFQGDRTP